MKCFRYTKPIEYIILAVVTFALAVYLELFFEAAYYYRSGIQSGFIAADPQGIHLIQLAGIWLAMATAGWALWRFHRPVLSFAYRYRYALAVGVLSVYVLLELSGSSIACLGNAIGSEKTDTVFGIPRSIRSDEYATFVPLALSQPYNSAGPYPYFSEIIRGTATDTFIISGLPSWDIAIIFRPFLWGFLVLGSAKGLAFMWVGRMLALFLVSFELAMVYSKKNKWLSLAAAALITWAPIVQWWGAFDMLISGQCALLCVYRFMRTGKTVKRIIASLLFFWFAGIYILTLYPAWQVPLLYVFAGLLLAIILENRKGFRFYWKTGLPAIATGLILLVAGLVHVWVKSGNTMDVVMNTVYPGQRIEAGGDGFIQLFRYCATLFFPLTGRGLGTNTCEASVFFDLFPMGILLSLYVIFIEKKKDKTLIPLLTVQVLLLAYCVIGFPDFVAKITLFSFSTMNRALIAVGLVNILLLIRSLALVERRFNMLVAAGVSTALAVVVGLAGRSATGAYINLVFGVAMVAVLVGGFFLVLTAGRFRKLFVLFCVLTVMISGALVNPVQRGIGVVSQNGLIQAIRSIAEKDHGLWIVEGNYPLTNVPIMAGAPTINSTNTYPSLERWLTLDPHRRQEDIYNRYAHIAVDLTDEQTRFDLIQADLVQLTLNYDDLKKLGVRYVLTAKDYGALVNPQVRFTLMGEVKGYRIYMVYCP